MYEEQKYFIEDIASYHIHAGEYFEKNKPSGCHSNYGGHKFDYFKPQLMKNGPLGSKDIVFYNSQNSALIKKSSVYPEKWSEFICDIKAIEVLTSKNIEAELSKNGSTLILQGLTSDNLKIKIYYDIAAKRIKTHYPDFL